jgi:hypothetical protein
MYGNRPIDPSAKHLSEYAAIPGRASLRETALPHADCADAHGLGLNCSEAATSISPVDDRPPLETSGSQILRNLLTRVAQIQIFRFLRCQNS